MARNQFQNFGFGGDRPSIRNEATGGFPAGDASSVVAPLAPGMMVTINPDNRLDVLPPRAFEKVAEMKRRREEASTLYRASFGDEQLVRAEIYGHEARIRQLQAPRGAGSYDLPDADVRVASERKRLDQKRGDLGRLLTAKEARGAESQRLGALLRRIDEAVATRPAGTVGKMVEVAPPGYKGDLLDAIEHRRTRTRELRADVDRARHAPHPSAVRKAAMVAQVEALAERGRPDAAKSIEQGEPIGWPLERFQCDIFNAAAPGLSLSDNSRT